MKELICVVFALGPGPIMNFKDNWSSRSLAYPDEYLPWNVLQDLPNVLHHNYPGVIYKHMLYCFKCTVTLLNINPSIIMEYDRHAVIVL